MPSGPGNKDHPVLSKYGRSVSGCPQVNLAARDLLVLIRERTQGARGSGGDGVRMWAPGPNSAHKCHRMIAFLRPGPTLGSSKSPRLLANNNDSGFCSTTPRRTSSNLRQCFGVHFRREFQSDNLIRKLDGNRVQVSCFLFSSKILFLIDFLV